MKNTTHGHARSAHGNPYLKLASMTLLMFVAMFALMYAMVDRLDNVLVNVNQLYMAGLMTGPMVLIDLALMSGMYPDRRINVAIAVLSAGVAVACWFGIRAQAGVADRQFLRSMIPHHGAAILMCEQAPIADRDVQRLCAQIASSQRREIQEMKKLLGESNAAD